VHLVATTRQSRILVSTLGVDPLPASGHGEQPLRDGDHDHVAAPARSKFVRTASPTSGVAGGADRVC
jgi:hypothetical protein